MIAYWGDVALSYSGHIRWPKAGLGWFGQRCRLRQVGRDYLQLVGATCILFAAKFELQYMTEVEHVQANLFNPL